MELRRDDFPVALQAFEVRDSREDFVAEQVVSTQAEADTFMSRFAGKLIKTRDVKPLESQKFETRKHSKGFPGWAIFLIVLIILVAVAYATGWLQWLINKAH
jgi:hypothetical protein